MAIVSIVGNVDKRIIAIPLARGLSIDGKTAIITDDSSYKRLYKDSNDIGTIDGLDIVIDYGINEESVNKLSETYEAYKHYVFVSDNFFHKESAITIVCRGVDRSLLADDVAETTGEQDTDGKPIINSKEIVLTVGKVDKKDIANTMQIMDKHYRYLGEIEETKTLDATADVVLAKRIASLVGGELGIPATTLEKLINRKKVIDSKEVSGRRKK